MKLTKKQRIEAVRILRKARNKYARYSNPGLYSGICFVIDDFHTIENSELCGFLTNLISNRLGGVGYYFTWILINYPHLMDGLTDAQILSKLREGRLAWFNALIKEFSE